MPAPERGQALSILEGLFTSTDGWDTVLPKSAAARLNTQLAGSIDPHADRVRIANKALLAYAFRKDGKTVSAEYEGLKRAWAKDTLRIDEPMDDATFYAKAGGWLQKRKAERAMLGEMAVGLFDNLRKGLNYEQAFEEQRKAHWLTSEGWDAANQDRYRDMLRSTWNHLEETRSRLEPSIERTAAFFRKARKGYAPEEQQAAVEERRSLVRELIGLGADAEMVLDFAAGLAGQDTTEEQGGFAGAMEKATKRLERGVARFGFEAKEGAKRLVFGPSDPMGARSLSADMERKLMQRLTGEVDPQRANGWVANGLLDALESFPQMTATLTPLGLVANGLAYKSELRAEFIERGVSPMQADTLSDVAAVPYAALDFVQAKMVFGKVPGLERVMAPIREAGQLSLKAGATRAATIFGVELAEQFSQEIAQDLTAPTVQALAGLLDDRIPTVQWGKEFERVAGASPQTLAALLPLVLVGTGTATFRDRAYGREYLRNATRWKALGFSDEQVGEIMSASTPAEVAAVARKYWNERQTGTAESSAAVAALNEEHAAAMEEAGMPAAGTTAPGLKPLPEGTTVEFQGKKHALFEGVGPKVDHWLVKLPGEQKGEVLTAEALANRGFAPPRKRIAPATPLGIQPGLPMELAPAIRARLEAKGMKPEEVEAEVARLTTAREMFNVTETIGALEMGSTVTGETLEAAGFELPPVQGPAKVTRNPDGTFTVGLKDGTTTTAVTPEEVAAIIRRDRTPDPAPVDVSTPGAALNARAAATSALETGAETEAGFAHHPTQPNPARLALQRETPGAISAPAVIESLANIITAAGERGASMLRVGRINPRRKALGFYRVRERIIRIKTANDLETAAHEVAHALDDALFGFGHGWKNVPKPAHAELMRLGRDLYGNKNPVGGYASEGFAEFIRLYLFDPEQLKEKAPQMLATFERQILAANNAVRTALERAQQAGVTFYRQGAEERARQGIARRAGPLAELKEQAANALETARRKWLEAAQPVADFVAAANEQRGRPVETENDPFFTMSARRLTSDAIVAYMAEKAMLDWAGNVVGPSLQQAFAIVQGKTDEFVIYLWASRALAVWGTGRNPGMTQADAEHLVRTLETPEFKIAAQQVYDWNNGVLNYAAQASPDFAETVRKIRAADPGFYIPLFREFEALDKRYASGPTGGRQTLVKRLKGSGRRIKDPVESMLAQAKAIVLKAQQKAVLDQIIKIAESTEGMGGWVTEVPRDKVAERVAGSQVAQQVQKLLKETSGAKALTAKQVEVIENEVLTFFVPAYQPKQNEAPVLPVFRNGETKWYELDPELYAALSGMDLHRLPPVLDLFFGMPARMVRLGTTGLRAAFSLVTNPLRDLRTLHMNSAASANSAQLFGWWLMSMRDLAVEAFTGGRVRSQWSDLGDRLGVEMAQSLTQDSRPLERAARRIKRGGKWAPLDMKSNLDLLREFLQFPETAARLAEIRAVAADAGWDPKQPLTPKIAAKLLVAGKQVTTDFTAAGELARVVNQAIPFFNAGIQGPRAHVRALQRDPHKFVLRGLMGTAAALALWLRNKDEEWWREMSTEERYLYTYIPVGDELIRLPRSFEVDGVFMALTEALADAWYQNEPERVTEWAGRFLSNLSQIDMVNGVPVPAMPVLPELALEQAANRDFFFDTPIVPRGELENVRPEEQYNEFTTSVSIAVGDLLNISPRRIDHTIRNLFGPVGIDLVGLFGRGDGSPTTERDFELADVPVFGVLFQRGGQQARSPRSIEELYDAYEKALHTQRSKRDDETLEQRRVRLMLQDAVRTQTALNTIAKHVPEREKRQELHLMRLAVARRALEMQQSGNINRGPNLEILGRAREQLRRELEESQQQGQ